jgi:hypothetical protein
MINKNKIKRVIILGSNSFIAKSVIKYLKLEKVKIIQLSRKRLNFYNKNSIIKLKSIVQNNDLIFLQQQRHQLKIFLCLTII